MSIRAHAVVIASLALVPLVPTDAHAEVQIWDSMLLQARLDATGGPAAWLDLHARRRRDSTLYIVRPALGYAFSPTLFVHAGYAAIPTDPDAGEFTTEHRSWQQVLWNLAASDELKFQVRGRLEQRFGSGDEIGNRVRLLGRVQWALGGLPLQLVVWDELFVQLDDTDWNLKSGFDQNRAFAGIGADTALRGVRVELGYMNLLVMGGDRLDHSIAVNVIANFVPR